MKFGRIILAALAAAFLAGEAQAQGRGRYWDQTSNGWRDYDSRGTRPFTSLFNDIMGFDRREINYASREKPGTIIIETKKFYLYYITGNGKAIRYGVGVGREGFGWKGTVHVGRKAEWPGWTPPPEMVAREKRNGRILPAYMEGGIDNPLGARAMYLYDGGRDTMFRIHGTTEPWTIGTNVSSGCIRLVNDDVVDLYKRVKVGAKVIVM